MGYAKAFYDAVPAPLQGCLLTLKGAQLRRRRFDDARYARMRAELQANDHLDAAAMRELQARLLRRLVRRAAREVPYYRRLFRERGLDPDAVRGPEDLCRLPILTKETVRTHRAELLSERYPRRRLLHAHTSGTTGSSLTFFWDRNIDVVTNALLWHHRAWGGLRFGEPYATLLGRVIVPLRRTRPPFWRLNRAWNQLFLSSFHMRQENLGSYVEAIRGFGAVALEAYPSTAYVLARYLESRGEVLSLRAVFLSSEPLLDFQREVIEERFDCPAFDYLGAAERVIFAGECEAHAGLHVFDEYGVTEVLDDRGEPVEAGRPGRLVLTSLHNFAMPFIRYEIGDVSGLRREACPCGRTRPLLLPVTTKHEDLVVLPDGRFISPSVLTHPFKPQVRIAASQIVQERPESIEVRIVPRPGFRGEDERRLRAAFRERLGEEVSVRIVRVAEIPRGPTGKFRWVVSKVPLRFGGRETGNLFSSAAR